MRRLILAATVMSAMGAIARAAEKPTTRLFGWERGIGVAPLAQEEMAVYLWFYEWNMFEAITPGQHTRGTYMLDRRVAEDGTSGRVTSPQLKLSMRAADGGADLKLEVTNRSRYDWPEIAGIIPCFNPGPAESRNRQFANTKTYYLAADGLEKLVRREIHFNNALRKRVDREAKDGQYVFSSKWPTSEVNAVAGLIVREATDGKWVTGIAWDDFLSAQGHNPWECMHLAVRVGPLRPGESKTVRGKIYLFQGTKEDLLRRFQEDFGPAASGKKK